MVQLKILTYVKEMFILIIYPAKFPTKALHTLAFFEISYDY